MERFICVHGHFYQPPRENPWFEEIERQESAHPYHDWNARVSAECYGPNTASRIVDARGHILSIVNNYERISFNFGPTLLSWMQRHDRETYQGILAADRESARRFGGHGSAMAQCFNHIIMPLATRRDKETQVRWGIRDFESRFRRAPEGMWLPETAVDIESLEVLAAAGIRFTVLAPRQAGRIRGVSGGDWVDVTGEKVDPTRAYVQRLPSGRSIAIFFYDGPISRGVAFERLLESGEKFADRLCGAFDDRRTHPQIVNIATDGETYGHHHRYGDMALAWALHSIETRGRARLINYGQYLEMFPPELEVQIIENTSWSCDHGVGRWRANCGCNTGGGAGWNQEWRKPLREAFDWLAQRVTPLVDRGLDALVRDPEAARHDYIQVVLDRSEASREEYISRHAKGTLGEGERIRLMKIMEIQRHAMLMYTSCGWFFDEVSGIETVQCMQYAGRVVQLANKVFDAGIDGEFTDLLGRAKSNVVQHRDGERIYEKQVRPSIVGFRKVVARYAIGSLLREEDDGRMFYYRLEQTDRQAFEAGKARLLCGRARIRSEITLDNDEYMFAVLHFGDHNFLVKVKRASDEHAYGAMVRGVGKRFGRADIPETISALDEHFGRDTFSLRSLFSDDRAAIIQRVIADTMGSLDDSFFRIYENNWPLMRYLVDIANPLPPTLKAVAQMVQNRQILDALRAEPMDIEKLRTYVEQARAWKIEFDRETLALEVEDRLQNQLALVEAAPSEVALLADLEASASIMSVMGVNVNLWRLQNAYFRIARDILPSMSRRGVEGDHAAAEWSKLFSKVGKYLSVSVNDMGGAVAP